MPRRPCAASAAGRGGILHRCGRAGISFHRKQEHGRLLRDAAGGLLLPSKLGHILTETPELLNYAAPAGRFIPYKGRAYCWVEISEGGAVRLTGKCWSFLHLTPGMRLLSIRSSDIAFTMGAKGPLLERAAGFDGKIPMF